MKYFLGANSCSGFYSLYKGFPPAEDSFLHIIKGGPGCGKSSFMSRLAKAAEAKGLEVDYVLCSGDPDSLDGIHIPALHQAWCDGTAPHAAEPEIFGVTFDYVNLGRFCRLPLSPADAQRIRELSRGYRDMYRQAYGWLAAAASIRDDAAPTRELPRWLRGRISQLLDNEISCVPARPAPPFHCFFSAISCKGQISFGNEISALCKNVYCFEAAAHAALELVRQEAESRGAKLILVHDPLDGDRLDAVLLPCCSLAFVSPGWDIPGQRHISFDAVPLSAQGRPAEPESDALKRGINLLIQAKAMHDELEAVYRPYMDFEALDAFARQQTELYIEKQLSP